MRSFFLGLLFGTIGPILVDRLRNRLKGEVAQDRQPATAATRAESSAELPGEGLSALDDLSQLTTTELYRRAQAAGIAGRSAMSKAQLIAALRALDG
jgi:hypothetical protein